MSKNDMSVPDGFPEPPDMEINSDEVSDPLVHLHTLYKHALPEEALDRRAAASFLSALTLTGLSLSAKSEVGLEAGGVIMTFGNWIIVGFVLLVVVVYYMYQVCHTWRVSRRMNKSLSRPSIAALNDWHRRVHELREKRRDAYNQFVVKTERTFADHDSELDREWQRKADEFKKRRSDLLNQRQDIGSGSWEEAWADINKEEDEFIKSDFDSKRRKMLSKYRNQLMDQLIQTASRPPDYARLMAESSVSESRWILRARLVSDILNLVIPMFVASVSVIIFFIALFFMS